jgi:ribosome-associated protein
MNCPTTWISGAEGVVRINDNLSIPENEISFVASRSGGPGGQNVNKVSSRVTLSFDVRLSTALSDEQKAVVLRSLGKRVNKEGILQIVSQRTRSQDMNRTDALVRFADLLRRALTPKRPRIKTRVPAAAKQIRLDQKKKRTAIKHARSKTGWDL